MRSKTKTPSVQVLESSLSRFRGDLTVADATAKSGLPLEKASEALQVLASEYSGQIAATSKGELVYSFPKGLVRPPETRLVHRIGNALAKFALGGVRLLVRAWVSVVLVGYAVAFLAVVIALAFRGGDDDRDRSFDGVGVVLRMIAEAVFWTFHPFSPVFAGTEPRWLNAGRPRTRRLPFYERVNRFVFGPAKVVVDPQESSRQIVAEIRRQKGRIAPGDVQRVTGLSREASERLLLRLVVDYHGDIGVEDNGAIIYSFPELRTTTQALGAYSSANAVAPIWDQRVVLAPLTGNTPESNLLFTAINGFNLAVSGYVLANDLTLDRLAAVLSRALSHDPRMGLVPLPPADSVPLVLGVIPFAFSLALFALPLFRWLRRSAEGKRVANENGWRGLLRRVLGSSPSKSTETHSAADLSAAWQSAGGLAPSETDLRDAVRRLGGEGDLNEDGTFVYRFDAPSREREALVTVRARASNQEVTPGKVVFSSADDGPQQLESDPSLVKALPSRLKRD